MKSRDTATFAVCLVYASYVYQIIIKIVLKQYSIKIKILSSEKSEIEITILIFALKLKSFLCSKTISIAKTILV